MAEVNVLKQRIAELQAELASIAPATPASGELVLEQLASALVPAPGGEFAALLPPGYSPTFVSYPLVLSLHGGGGSRDDLPREAYEKAWSTGQLRPCVVVTPSCKRTQYLNTYDGSERWFDYIVEELLPFVRQRFNVAQGRESTIITGTSMGGGGALRIAFSRPDLFQAVAVLEPDQAPTYELVDYRPRNHFHKDSEAELFAKIHGAWPPVDAEDWNSKNAPYILRENIAQIRAHKLRVYLECGTADMLHFFEGAEFLHRALWELGVEHEYRSVDGANHVGASLPMRQMDQLGWVERQLKGRYFGQEPPKATTWSPEQLEAVQAAMQARTNNATGTESEKADPERGAGVQSMLGTALSGDNMIAVFGLVMQAPLTAALALDPLPGFGRAGAPRVVAPPLGGAKAKL